MPNIIYDESTVLYDQVDQQYGGIQDFYKISNSLVDNVKTKNHLVLNTKTSNKLVDERTTGETYYWRIYAGMPMGLLLAITYSEDQNGELRT